MSVFPRKVCNGEYVIFHMGFKGILDENKSIDYCLNLYNPTNKKILNIKKDLLIRGNNKLYEKNLYYPILIDDSFIPGKYIIDFYLVCDGKKIKSSTKNTDYFNVEKVESKFYKDKENNKVILNNKSNECTSVLLYLEGNKKIIKKEIMLLPQEEKIIITKCSKAFIEYGNNNFSMIRR